MELILGAILGAPFAMWAGDYLGRKYPTQWAALRMGLKAAGKARERE